MKFTAQEEYGLRCALQVARHPGGVVTIPEIAEREGLTTAYVAKLMRVLLKAGVVQSTRGNQGGYRLSQPASEVTVGIVIHALGGGFFPEGFCNDHGGTRRACVHSSDCAVRSVWVSLDAILRDTMDRITLDDLLTTENRKREWVPLHVEPMPGSRA